MITWAGGQCASNYCITAAHVLPQFGSNHCIISATILLWPLYSQWQQALYYCGPCTPSGSNHCITVTPVLPQWGRKYCITVAHIQPQWCSSHCITAAHVLPQWGSIHCITVALYSQLQQLIYLLSQSVCRIISRVSCFSAITTLGSIQPYNMGIG